MEIPERESAAKMRHCRTAQPELPAFGWDKSRNGRGGCVRVRIICRNWFNVEGRTTSVVAVKAETGLCIDVGSGPRTEGQACLRTRQDLGGCPGVRRGDHAGDIEVLQVTAHCNHGAEFCRPLDLVFHVEACLRVREPIRLCCRRESSGGVGIRLVHPRAVLRLEEAVVDPVVANLEAERVFDLAAEPLGKDGLTCVEAGHPAPVLLLKLIASNGVCQVIGEVGEEIEVVVEAIGGNAG